MTVWKEHKGVAHLIINRMYLLIKHLWKSQQKNRAYNEFFYHSFESVSFANFNSSCFIFQWLSIISFFCPSF